MSRILVHREWLKHIKPNIAWLNGKEKKGALTLIIDDAVDEYFKYANNKSMTVKKYNEIKSKELIIGWDGMVYDCASGDKISEWLVKSDYTLTPCFSFSLIYDINKSEQIMYDVIRDREEVVLPIIQELGKKLKVARIATYEDHDNKEIIQYNYVSSETLYSDHLKYDADDIRQNLRILTKDKKLTSIVHTENFHGKRNAVLGSMIHWIRSVDSEMWERILCAQNIFMESIYFNFLSGASFEGWKGESAYGSGRKIAKINVNNRTYWFVKRDSMYTNSHYNGVGIMGWDYINNAQFYEFGENHEGK